MKKNLLLIMVLAMFACFSCKSGAKTEEPTDIEATEEVIQEETTEAPDTTIMEEVADTTVVEETAE